MKMNPYKRLIDIKVVFIIFVVIAIVVSCQAYFLGGKSFDESGHLYTHYNNYLIFKQSFFHLTAGKDLYIVFPNEHFDFYKYSPAFALFMGAFAYLPNLMGLLLWNLLNVLILFLAVYFLPKFDLRTKTLLLLLLVIELVTSQRNSQSNALLAGLIVMGFNLLENRKYFWATFFILFSVYIKLFGGVALLLFAFYPDKWKLVVYSLFWGLLLFFLPLIVISFEHLKFLYASWEHLLANDFSRPKGLSVIDWLNNIARIPVSNGVVVITGFTLLSLALVRIKQYMEINFRLLYLSSILIWVVIFNHKAESPTFIIAMTGVVIWFFSRKPDILTICLLCLALLLTSLSSTDLFPKAIRDGFFVPYGIKALPCIIIWLKVMTELYFNDYLKKSYSSNI